MRADDGLMKSEKQEIADVFATFYEELYRTRREGGRDSGTYACRNAGAIAAFTPEELADALKQMKSGKAGDAGMIFAEMIKVDCPVLHAIILDVFNDILQPGHQTPPEWRLSRLVVIFKKGDPAMPANYRPIAILPILYKVFSRMLCARLKCTIIGQQSVDQAAYRQGFSTEDHLLCVTLLLERSSEWNAPVWLGLVDFEKAFDTVEHSTLWCALCELGVQS